MQQSRHELYAIANTTITKTYFHLGRSIIEHEQQGNKRATYAKETLIKLSAKLTGAPGKEVSADNLENMRTFFKIESPGENRSTRTLQRQYDSALFERLALNRNKANVIELSKKSVNKATAATVFINRHSS